MYVCSVLYGGPAKGVNRRHRGALCSAYVGRAMRCACGSITRLLVSAATSGYHIRTAVRSTQPAASTSTEPHKSPVNRQQANHNNRPDVLGPLFPGVRAKAKIIGDDFRVMPSRMRLEVRSQYNLNFDPEASTLDAPQPPWEAQRPPGVEMWPCMSAAPGASVLPSARLSASVHSFERPVGCTYE